MTSYKVLVSSTASKKFKTLLRKEQCRVREKLKELTENSHNNSNRLDIKKLSGTNHRYFRQSIVDYRVIYFLQEETIRVVRIATRSDAYPWLD